MHKYDSRESIIESNLHLQQVGLLTMIEKFIHGLVKDIMDRKSPCKNLIVKSY